MNYNETLEWMFSQLPMYQRIGKAAYKADLDNTLALDRYFNYPHKKFKSIHIAGTNGKGSVSHMIASVLQKSGYKVGLYTSPHLKDFRERIKINGQMVPESHVVEFINKHVDILRELHPSFFEMTVAMAFDYFASSTIDIAVIEVGMGGRLDSTNIITPELSVITNIGLDHTIFLGDTLDKIAQEKAGIIKKNIPVVIGETQKETEPVFRRIANENQSDIYFADKEYFADIPMLSLDNKQLFKIKNNKQVVFNDIKLDLLGNYQKKNIITVIKALDILKPVFNRISDEPIFLGLENVVKNTGLLGRWQILDHKPLTICDTGHNLEGIAYIVGQLKNIPYKHLHMVFGVVEDKNLNPVLEILPKDATYYFTRASIPRALDQEILLKAASNHGLYGKPYDQVKGALNDAKLHAGPDDLIFIGGSTFVVAEAL